MTVKAERQREILAAIRKHGKITIAELSAQFDVSDVTTRRDLKALEEQGHVERAHGGLVYSTDNVTEPPIIKRQQEHREAKIKIARATADLIPDGESVFIGSGSTAMLVARFLKDRQGLTVITNALSVLNELAPFEGMSVVVLGGMLRASELSMIGHVTEQALREVRVDKVIFGIRAIDVEAGLTNEYLPEVMTDRAILGMGTQVILVADHSKFGRIASAFVAPLQDITTLVTDAQTDAQMLNTIREMGVEVIVAT